MNFLLSLKSRIKKYIEQKKHDYVAKWAMNRGLTICRIVNIAGTDYIEDKDGTQHRIGAKRKN